MPLSQDRSYRLDRKRSIERLLLIGAAIAVIGLSACSGGDEDRTFSGPSVGHAKGLSFRYPQQWSVSGFSRRTTPSRLVVASYRVHPSQVEGDCGGSEALRRMPRGGAAVLLIDYGSGEGFRPHPAHFKLSQFRRADYECFGESYMLRFRRNGHDLQAHLALGSEAHATQRAQALAILDSVK
jgi:hypothetical protein